MHNVYAHQDIVAAGQVIDGVGDINAIAVAKYIMDGVTDDSVHCVNIIW